jgi:hypothetical protein
MQQAQGVTQLMRHSLPHELRGTTTP